MPRSPVFRHVPLTLLCALVLMTSLPGDSPGRAAGEVAKADELYEQQNFQDAAAEYAAFLESKHPEDDLWHASLRLVQSHLRLQHFDEAIEAAGKAIERFPGSLRESRARRVLADMYLTIPHWGTEKGGKFHRGRWDQGTQKDATASDKERAVEQLERARSVLAALSSDPARVAKVPGADREKLPEERIETQFQLVAALTRFSPYDQNWNQGWSGWLGEEHDPDDETVGEEADEGGFHGKGRGWGGHSVRPRGIPVDERGEPSFAPEPESWSPELPMAQKVKFLLSEIERLDPTEGREHAALAVYRRAMLARTRYGRDRLETYRWWWDGSSQPYQDAVEEARLHELEDDEALTLVGTRIARVRLPDDEDVLGLLRSIPTKYPRASIVGEALYAIGLYHQSREQYPQAVKAFDRVIRELPEHPRASSSQIQRQRILRPEVALEQTGMQLAGRPGRIPLSHRNATGVRLRLWRLDLERYVKDFTSRIARDVSDATEGFSLNNLSYSLLQQSRDGRPNHEIYQGEKVAEWVATVNRRADHRYERTEIESPVTSPGCYMVEATVEGGAGSSKNLMFLSSLAVVRKQYRDRHLYFVTDAATGAPAAGAGLTHFQYWTEYKRTALSWKQRVHFEAEPVEARTDADGVSLFRSEQRNQSWPQVVTIARGADGSWAFHGVEYFSAYYSPSNQWQGRRLAMLTDRPVYRPEQTVKYKAWLRDYDGGEYRVVAGGGQRVEIRDPQGNVVHQATLPTSENGTLDGQFKLEEEPPLGLYSITVGGYSGAGGQFRVEEYKKPEFEVTVDVGSELVRLGQKVEATLRATYYFGAPVSEGRVTYKVFREPYDHRWVAPGYWDWLYGPGYGKVWYPCEWLPWWDRHGPHPLVWYPWWGAPPRPERELVLEGQGRLESDGTLKVELDTSKALADHPDQDHLYSIEAEVVDASRRTITGSGAVKVTRSEFYSFLEVDRGYYQPGDQLHVTVKAVTANGTPVASTGKLTLSSIVYRGEGGATSTEEPHEAMDAATDAEGNFTATLKAPRSGQYKLAYETRDSQGRAVVGAQVVWVRGDDFQAGRFRFNELELFTDKRTYAPGETARLMINSSSPQAAVLFSDRTDRGVLTSYRVVRLTEGSALLDLPVAAKDTPNFFVEATTVVGGKVRQEAREVLVPPAQEVMNLELTMDRKEYRPGQEGKLRIRATTPGGEPVRTELALTVFDRSVLYIQPELAPDLRATFWGERRTHGFQMQTNLDRTFQPIGTREDPAQYVTYDSARDWFGSWGTRWVDFATADLESEEGIFGQAEGGGGGDRKKMRASLGGVGKDEVAASKAMAPGGAAAPAPADAMMMRQEAKEADGGPAGEAQPAAGSSPAYQAAKVRSEFEDTAFWAPSLVTDGEGIAETTFRFPENLTTWRLRALAMNGATRVGDGSGSAVTTKKLVLRLQAPRFFVERDRVTLSANVHNYLETPKRTKVSIRVPEELMELVGPASREIDIPAGGEARVDWEVIVRNEGFATIEMEGLTDEESDAVRMGFPVLVHGMEKTVSRTGLLRASDPDFAEVSLDVPAERRPEASRLELRFSPSLAGAMLEAVPYLLDYPYGCTEQTMSRFLPAVLVQRSLLGMGVRLEDLAKARTNLDSQQLGEAGRRAGRSAPGHPAIYSEKTLASIVAQGLDRLEGLQHPSGGWGWWADDSPSPYLTAYVLWGLVLATQNDLEVPASMIERGTAALEARVARDVKDWQDGKGAWDEQAFVAHVLSMRHRPAAGLLDLLFERRAHLGLYGKALLSLALRGADRSEQADLVLQNIRQREQTDRENQTTWYETPAGGWWYWWNNDIESHAWILQAILAKDPKDPAAPGIVKWLLNNRKNGTYWRSTRDTALCVAALIDYMRLTKESSPDYTLEVSLDGELLKQVHVTRENMLTFDNGLTLTGDRLTSGRHTLRVQRKGKGAVYFSSYLTYFTKEEGIAAAGLEVKVDRSYFKLERDDRIEKTEGSRLQEVEERRLRYRRIPIAEGDRLESGDQIEVELKVTSKNDYDYLVFEDYKPAGCEPVELRSGTRYGELISNMELRDEKVAFFVTWLTQGEHLIRYRLRAEVPGTFHALPTKAWAMYAPEIRANSDEQVIGIVDAE